MGQSCVLHYWMFRNHHLSKPFQALCCPMPIHQYSESGLKWNAPNAMEHLTHMPKYTNSLMSDHNFITIHWQTTSPHFLKRSLSFCTSRIHAHQSDHVVKIIMLQFLHNNYNNSTKNAKLKLMIKKEEALIGFIRLKTGTSGELLWTH
jgi:hypothetical protein